MKTKEKNVEMQDAVITQTSRGGYMAQGTDGKGKKMTTMLSKAAAEEAVVPSGAIAIDLAGTRVGGGGGEVHLTPTEWWLLEVLVRNRGRLVSQQQLLGDVWGPAYHDETNYLRVYVANLRRKLEATPSQPDHLITEPGMGYRFIAD